MICPTSCWESRSGTSLRERIFWRSYDIAKPHQFHQVYRLDSTADFANHCSLDWGPRATRVGLGVRQFMGGGVPPSQPRCHLQRCTQTGIATGHFNDFLLPFRLLGKRWATGKPNKMDTEPKNCWKVNVPLTRPCKLHSNRNHQKEPVAVCWEEKDWAADPDLITMVLLILIQPPTNPWFMISMVFFRQTWLWITKPWSPIWSSKIRCCMYPVPEPVPVHTANWYSTTELSTLSLSSWAKLDKNPINTFRIISLLDVKDSLTINSKSFLGNQK